MRWKRLLPLTIAWVVSGQSLEDVLTAQSATLSTLNAWLTSQQVAFEILSNVQGVTLLAPSNNALNQLYSSPLYGQLASDPNLLVAFLSYHVLDGIYFMSDIGATQLASLPTFMNMNSYSNVSGGQVIEAVTQNNQVTFVTGNGAQANVEPYVSLSFRHHLSLSLLLNSPLLSRTSTTSAARSTSSTRS